MISTGIGFAASIRAARPANPTPREKDAAMLWKSCLLGLAMTSLLGFAQLASAQRQTTADKNETTVTKTETTTTAPAETTEPKLALKLKVFKLKHCKPSEIAQLLAGPNSFGGAAHLDEKRLLFVRGPQERIKRIETVVNALDVPPEKLEKHKIGSLHLIPLRNTKSGSIQSILNQLGLHTSTVQLGKASVIVLRDTDEADVEQVEEVVAELDQADSIDATTKTDLEAAIRR
jgi:type II secretory pathway component GspD/PulD (secretin)